MNDGPFEVNSLITVLCHNGNLGVDCKNTNKRAKYKIGTHFFCYKKLSITICYNSLNITFLYGVIDVFYLSLPSLKVKQLILLSKKPSFTIVKAIRVIVKQIVLLLKIISLQL